MSRWSVVRDADPGCVLAHALRFDGATRMWLNAAEGEAFQALIDAASAATPEELPAGAVWGVLLPPLTPLPEGWRYIGDPEVRGQKMIAAGIEPVPPEPETERVPWWEAVSGRRTVVHPAGPENNFVATSAFYEGSEFGIGTAYGADDAWVTPDADGMVSVLKETGR